MPQNRQNLFWIRFLLAVFLGWVVCFPAETLRGQDESGNGIQNAAAVESDGGDFAEIDDEAAADSELGYHNERVRGRVVWLAEALKQQFEISTVPEARERILAIATDEGKLIPLVENLRGRAFRKDERLRDRPMEIWIRRHDDQPLAQVLRVFELAGDDLLEVDYWCDVCAIVMFETGPCSCCQDDNRLRKRPVSPSELDFSR